MKLFPEYLWHADVNVLSYYICGNFVFRYYGLNTITSFLMCYTWGDSGVIVSTVVAIAIFFFGVGVVCCISVTS